jgi:hypothetical protein
VEAAAEPDEPEGRAPSPGMLRKFGRKGWELDAIEPEELQAICKRSIERLIDWPKWERRKAEIEATSKRIRKHAAKFKG